MYKSTFDTVRVYVSQDVYDRIVYIRDEYSVKSIATVVKYLILNCDGHNLHDELVLRRLNINKKAFLYNANVVKDKATKQIRIDYEISNLILDMVDYLKSINKRANVNSVLTWVLDMNGR